MPNYNKIVMVGHLTRDFEIRSTKGGTIVGTSGLATNRKWGDNEEVCFVDITMFGKTAEIAGSRLTKGEAILVEGRLKLDRWEDKDGNKRSKHSIVVESFQFLGGGGGKPEAAPAAEEEIPF